MDGDRLNPIKNNEQFAAGALSSAQALRMSDSLNHAAFDRAAASTAVAQPQTRIASSTQGVKSQSQKHAGQPSNMKESKSKPSNAQGSSSNQLEHRYYVDTQDIILTLKGTAKILQSTRFERFSSATSHKTSANANRATSLPRDLHRGQNLSQLGPAAMVAQGDVEAMELIKFVEDRTSVSVDQFL